MPTTTIKWGDRELEVEYTLSSGDWSVGLGPGADDMCVVSVDGVMDEKLNHEAQTWLDDNEAAQMEVNEAAIEYVNEDWDAP